MPHYAIFFIFFDFPHILKKPVLIEIRTIQIRPNTNFALYVSRKNFLRTQIFQHYQKLLTWIGTLPAFGAMLDNDKIGQLYNVIHHYFRYQSQELTVIF